MTFANGAIGEIIKAVDVAAVEMLVISLPDARIVDATRSLMLRWQCTKYEIIGKQLSQSPEATFHARYVSDSASLAPGGATTRIEVTFRTPQGKIYNVRFRPQHLRDDSGEFLLLIAPVEARQTGAEKLETEARLELAVKAGGYGSWSYDFRSRSHVISPELYEILGYHPGDGALQFTHFEDNVHPDDRDRTLGAAIKRDPHARYWQDRFRYRNARGEYIWVEQIAAVIHDPLSGDKAKTIGLIRDVTKRMNERHRLEASERNLARSQTVAGIGSWVIDIATGEVEWSLQMYVIFGLKVDGQPPSFDPILATMSPEHRADWHRVMDNARTGQPVSPIIVDFLRPSGERRRMEVHVEVERAEGGEARQLYGICRDITEHDLLERKFLQAQKMESIGRLTGGIAHDFNNLLSVMVGNLQLVEQVVQNEPDALKRVRSTIEVAAKGSELTRRMLALSRREAMHTSQVEVNRCIGEMGEMLARAIGSGIDLKFELGADVWPVSTDPTQLETAILNLAINARDAMPEGGAITVRSANRPLTAADIAGNPNAHAGQFVCISVSDTGEGIADDVIDKVTEPFFTTKDPDKGSGLGLSMIAGLAKQAGGFIDIASSPGQGTTVSIYLPRAGRDDEAAGEEPAGLCAPAPCAPAAAAAAGVGDAGDAGAAPSMSTDLSEEDAEVPDSEVAETTNPQDAAEPGEATSTARRDSPVVLVVEDNPAVRDVAVAMIEDMGCTVLEADGGEAAMKIIAERDDIDLLLSDVVMAGMNGPELALEAIKLRPNLKVLFASGYTQGAVENMPEAPNVLGLVDKPFTREQLNERVSAALARDLAA